MMRWLSIAVIVYMIMGITWWGVLLFQKNEDVYRLQSAGNSTEANTEIRNEYRKQKMMIVGEGLILGVSLLLGIYIIYRSGQREIRTVQQQNNFLLSVSHELKSPIAAIKLAFETLNRANLPEAKAQKIRNSGIKDSDRLEQLVQNLLISSSIEDDKLELYKENVDLKKLLEDLRISYQEKYDRKIILNEDSKEVLIRADHQSLQRAFSNILHNALKYSDAGTPVEIDLKSGNPHHIEVHFSNDGPHISEAERELIFKRFFRGKEDGVRKKEGTGIGLYVSDEIIKAHRGSIRLDQSREGKVTFIITLPIS